MPPEATSPSTPASEYRRRLAALQLHAASAARAEMRFAWAKILAVLLALVLAWEAIISNRIAAAWLLPAAAVLVLLFLAHGRSIAAHQRLRRLVLFYQRGLARLQPDPDLPRPPAEQGAHDGSRFRDPNHVYADDLDIFGPGSLFLHLSTARTPMGEQRLADWLRAPAPVAEVSLRQARVAALRPSLDLRESMAILGDELTQRLDPARLAQWAALPPRFLSWAQRLAYAIVALATLAALMAAFAGASLGWFVALVLLQIALAAPRDQAIAAACDLGANRDGLRTFAAVLAASGAPAQGPAALNRLARLSDWTETSGSLRRLLDFTALYGLQLAFFSDAWRRRFAASLPAWLDAVAEFEALLSLSSFAYEHPADPFAELIESPTPIFDGEGLGHPLLPETECVRNDCRLGPESRLWLVSGSNMSGKSTFLRTVGVNAVLAQAGAPVRARRLRLSPLAVGTRLRTSDSLQQGRSGFYAEILRLRQVVELQSAHAPPVLFLFDELMEGTNSHDRVVGAEGLLRALLAHPSLGLVTTHDLTLAALADKLGPAVRNVHFEDQIEGNDVKFDHRLRDGVVTKSNALALMRIIGLRL